MSDFAYYYGTDAEQFNFFRLPKKLILDGQFDDISIKAKILYSILLDRMTLSARNGWVDEENRVYIIYTVKEVMEEFGCSERKAIALMSELDTHKGIGLIEKKRQGLGKPNIIFVRNFNSVCTSPQEETKETKEKEGKSQHYREKSQTEDKCLKSDIAVAGTSAPFSDIHEPAPEDMQIPAVQDMQIPAGQDMQIPAGQDMQIPAGQDMQIPAGQDMQIPAGQDMQIPAGHNNNTDYNQIYINNQSIHQGPSLPEEQYEGWMDRDLVRKILNQKLSYAALLADSPRLAGVIQEIFRLLTDACCYSGHQQKIGSEMISTQDLRSRFMQLNMGHIRYVLQALEDNGEKIKNIRGYVLTCLYNAPATMSLFYQSEVRHAFGTSCGGGRVLKPSD